MLTQSHMKQQSGRSLFTFVEPAPLGARFFAAGVAVHATLLTAAVLLPLFFFEPIRVKRYDVTLMAPPMPTRPRLQESQLIAPVLPKQKPPKVEPLPKPAPIVAELKPAPVPAPAPAPKVKQPEVRRMEPKRVPAVSDTPVFEARVSERPVETRAKVVQTGGFGDTNGLPSDARSNKPANIATLGSFDLPVGEGAGNGRGGTRGERGIVMASGFDSEVSGGTGSSGGGKAKAGVVGDVFGTVTNVAQTPKRVVKSVEFPVEILYKPRPEYTEGARRLRVEGEVSLRVLFAATGRIQVLNVIRGLGYGLDENAVRAAQQIQFKPASSDGTPVDSTATVRIAFQLAY